MHKSILRLSAMFFLFALSLAGNVGATENNFYQDGITLTITNKPFDKKAHKIHNCSNTPCIIDEKIFYGGNGKLPKMEVESLVFSQNGKKYRSMFHPFTIQVSLIQILINTLQLNLTWSTGLLCQMVLLETISVIMNHLLVFNSKLIKVLKFCSHRIRLDCRRC